MARPAVVIALPNDEATPVAAELREAGFQAITVTHPDQLDALLATRRDVAVAILDGETDFNLSLEYYGLLREGGRAIPALMVVSPRALDQLSVNVGSVEDEYVTRPYSAESLRWRIEAMCIRSQTVDDGSGPVLQGGSLEADDWTRRATVIAVFNPKGGVGKTTVATNLASALQLRKDQSVLLIDADTVTGHVTTSLGIEGIRTVVDSWRDELEGGPVETLSEIASAHSSGMKVVALTASPLHTEILEAERVSEAITAARRGFDFVVVDLHPSYGPLNQAIFEIADRILVPVTPDVPAIRAAVQLAGIASELGIRERLALVINRANSGVSVADMEKTVGMPSLALIRSGGLLFVRAANEGRTVIDLFPKEKISEDFDALADRVLGTPEHVAAAKGGFGIFNRQRAAARA
jgi:pilus assembly protein CpaE